MTHAPVLRCDACRLTAADWSDPDAQGVRWSAYDIRPRPPHGRTLCRRCADPHHPAAGHGRNDTATNNA